MLLLFSLGANFVLALEINYPPLPDFEPPQDFVQHLSEEEIFPHYVEYFFRLAIWSLGFIALGVLVYGGILYLISSGNPERLASAKEYISSAFFGILLLLTSYLILSIISPGILSLKPLPKEEIKIEEEPHIPKPDIKGANTSIHVELPFGRLIEGRIFETYISELPNHIYVPPRMTRITTNASSTLDIASKLSANSQELSSLAQECNCRQADPVCGWPPRCSPLGQTPLSNILGPQGLSTYTSLTDSISNTIGSQNLGKAIGLSENIARGTTNVGELSSVLNSIDGISNSINLSQNLPKAFDIAENISSIARNPQNLIQMIGSIENLNQIVGVPVDLSQAFEIATNAAIIAGNPENLGNILASTENITDIVGVSEDLTDIYNVGYNIAIITENPTAYSSVVGSIANITNILEIPADLSQTFSLAYDIASVAEDPSNMVSVLMSNQRIADVMDSIGASSNLDQVFNVGSNIAAIAANPNDYSTIVGSAANIANLLEVPGDLSQGFSVAYDMAVIAENPGNLSRVLSSVERISDIVETPAYLTPAFEMARDIGAIAENPLDLRTVLIASEDITRKVNSSQDITEVFNKAYQITGVVEDFKDFPEVMGSMKRLSRIFNNQAHLEQVMEIAKEKGLEVDTPEELIAVLRNDLDFIHVIPEGRIDETLDEIKMISEKINDLTNLGEIERVIREIEDLVPDIGSMGITFEKVEDISRLVREPEDLRNLGIVLEDLSFLSPEVGESAAILHEFGEISVVIQDLAQLGDLENLVGELIHLTGDYYGLNETLNNFQGIAAVIQNPEDLRNIQWALEDLSRVVPELSDVSDILYDFQGIGAVIQDPTDINNIQIALADLSQVIPEAGGLSQFLGEYAGIASLIQDPTDFQNLQLAVDNLSEIIPQTGNISQLLENVQGIGAFIQNPTDFQNLQGALNDLSRIIPEAGDLSQFLGEFENIAAVIQDPTDLRNIQGALNDLSQVVPEAGDLANFLGEFKGISGIIQDPTNVANIMNAASELAKVAPQLSPVLGQLSSLGGLFGGPQAIIGAFAAGSCTCDTCKSSRGEIEKLQQENVDNLIPSLKQEQRKTIKERKSLKEELERLERAGEFIQACPYTLKESLTHFFQVKENYTSTKNGIVRQFPFWKNVLIPYLAKNNETVSDWASFLCLIGGNILSTSSPVEQMGEIPITSGSETCFQEIPVGEIIDRTLRTGELMREKMKKLIELDREIISKVDKLQVLVSQCTSQAPPCYSVCIPVIDEGVIVNCIQWCEGTACPYGEIKEQAKKIEQVLERKEGIRFTINNPKPQQQQGPSGFQQQALKEEIGLIPIINTIVPKILKDLKNEVRHPMLACEPQQHKGNLIPCNRAIGKSTPEGLVQGCAQDEDFFNPCLEKCYLKENQKTYTTCLQNCLKNQEQVFSGLEGSEKISGHSHKLNFFCCPLEVYEE